jgi:hypothetical protein
MIDLKDISSLSDFSATLGSTSSVSAKPAAPKF